MWTTSIYTRYYVILECICASSVSQPVQRPTFTWWHHVMNNICSVQEQRFYVYASKRTSIEWTLYKKANNLIKKKIPRSQTSRFRFQYHWKSGIFSGIGTGSCTGTSENQNCEILVPAPENTGFIGICCLRWTLKYVCFELLLTHTYIVFIDIGNNVIL